MCETNTEEGAFQSFERLIEPDWFEDLVRSTVWLRIYQTMQPPAISRSDSATITADLPVPIKLSYRRLKGVRVVRRLDIPSNSFNHPEGGITLLPEDNYAIVTSPLRIDLGHEGYYSPTQVKLLLDSFVSLCRLHFGHNALWRLMYEGEHFAHNGVWAKFHDSIKMPQPIQGP